MSRQKRSRRRDATPASQSLDRYGSTCEACGALQDSEQDRKAHTAEFGHRHFRVIQRGPADYMTRAM